jgi:hypothetical protein
MLKIISSDPISTKLSQVLQADQLVSNESSYLLSAVKNPLQKMSSLWYGSEDSSAHFTEAHKFVQEKELKNIQMFKED